MVSWSKGMICLLSFAVLTGCAGSTRAPDADPPPTGAEAPAVASGLTWRAELLRIEDTGQVTPALRENLASENPTRRRAAVRTLGFVRDSSLTDALLAAFEDSDPGVRAEAILTAGLAGVTATRSAIIERRADEVTLVRSAVAAALGLLPGPETIAPLTELIADEVKDVRMAACYSAARQTGAEDIVDTLLEAVDDPDSDVGAAAVYALSRLSARLDALEFTARFKIRERLVQLAQARNPGMLILIAEGLYSPLAGEQADTLHMMMQNVDQPEVLLAILRSTSIPGAPTFVFHEVLIKHRDTRVVHGVLLGLGRMKGDSVSALLLDFILEDSRDWLRAEAIRSLARADKRLMLQIANGLSNDPRALIRGATAETLYGREEPEAAEYARRLFDADDGWVRLQAIPAMASVEEPLTTVFSGLLKKTTLETKSQMIRAARYRLAMDGRNEADHADAVDLLDSLWKHAVSSKSAGIQLDLIEAAATSRREDGAAIVRKALKSHDLGVRRRAVQLLETEFNETAVLEPTKGHSLSHYERIAEWAERPHAAVITVARQGFIPGRFTISLNSRQSPLTAWRFTELANQGFFDNRRVDPYLPGLRLHSGRGSDDRYALSTWRAEPVFSLFEPGTVAVAGEPEALLGEWLVTLSARPNYLGRYVPIGRVVQNLPGVVANVLPIDRVVSIRAYEGNGQEPLPPLE